MGFLPAPADHRLHADRVVHQFRRLDLAYGIVELYDDHSIAVIGYRKAPGRKMPKTK